MLSQIVSTEVFIVIKSNLGLFSVQWLAYFSLTIVEDTKVTKEKIWPPPLRLGKGRTPIDFTEYLLDASSRGYNNNL